MRSTPRIYVVEDDSSVRKSLHRLLTSAGFDVDIFSSSRSFLDAVPREAVGVLILDLRTQEGDGFHLHEKMTELGYTLRIIFITEFPQEMDQRRAAEVGALGILTKPFSADALLKLISRALGAGKPAREG